jgi:hypothetical protein
VLRTRPPLDAPPKRHTPFDLHVLRTPPAFVLSQDQTRHSVYVPDKTTPIRCSADCEPTALKGHHYKGHRRTASPVCPLPHVFARYPVFTLLLLLTLQLFRSLSDDVAGSAPTLLRQAQKE